MQSVSQAFKQAILNPGRMFRPRVTIGYTDPFLDQSIDVQVSESNRSAAYTQACNGKEQATAKYMSLEPGRSVLGAGLLLPSAAIEIGWRGRQLSNAQKAFAAPYPTLTLTISPRPLDKLRLMGDDKAQEYATDFTINVYRGEQLAHTETVTSNTKVKWEKDIAPLTDVTKLVLTITKWSHASRFVKVIEFFSSVQEVYEGDDIISMSLLEEREVEGGSLPVGNISSNELSIKLQNQDRKFAAGNANSPLYRLLKPNRRLKAELGLVLPDNTVEYIPLFSGWTQDWQAPENALWAGTSARDRLEVIRTTTFSASEVYTDISLAHLAEIVLTDAGVANYYIDPELEQYVIPYCWFEPMSHRDALRQIVSACLGQAYCGRDGTIRIEGPSFLAEERKISQLTITDDHYFKKDCPALWDEVSNVVEVAVTPLVPDAVEEVFCDFEPRTGGGKVTITYQETPVIDAVASVEGDAIINSANYFAWGAELDITGDDYIIVVEGRVLRPSGAATLMTEDVVSIRDNGRLVYTVDENPFLQTAEMGQRIADGLLALFAEARRDITMDWIGHPALELGDRITAPDFKGSTRDYHVISQQVEIDGGLRATLKGRVAL